MAVVGPSGSGKSSIVKAGLIPAIRRGALPDSTQWFITEMQPGTHPLEELEAALLRVAVNPLPGLLSNLSEDRRGLVRAVKRVLPTDQTVELVLVIDQFEELFTLTADEEVRQHFIDNLLSAVSDTRGRIRIILTLRADFYDRPLSYPRLAELARSHSEFVIPLTPDELERAIAGPAEQSGLSLEPRLVATIINDVVRGPGTLPLLQFALTELFERRRGHTLTLEAYRETGGIRGALTHRADQLYNELSEAEQAAVRQLFLRLVTLGEGTEDTRRRVLQSELETLPDYRVLEEIIDIFSHHRMLTFDHDPVTRSSTVEIAHESLIREWGNMRNWLTTSRELLRLHHRIMESAAEWLRNGKEAGFLSVGTRLSQFETLMHESDIALNAVELEYLQASIAARENQLQTENEQRQRELELAQQAADSANTAANNARRAAAAQKQAANRLYYLVGALGIFLMIATILAIVTFNESRVAQTSAAEAQNVALVAGSRAALARYDTDLALALAWQAVALNPTSDLAQTALSQSAYAPGTVRQYVGHTAPVWRVAFSPGDQTFLSGGTDGTLILWNTATGAIIHQIKDDQIRGYIKVAFSPDGHTAIYGGDSGMLGLMDTATGEVIRRFRGHNGWVAAVGFSSDGQPYSCGQDGVLVVWDVETGTAVHRFTGPTAATTDCIYSSENSMAAAGFRNGTLMIWDTSSGDPLHRFETGQLVQSVDLSSDGLYVLAGMFDSIIYLWDLQSQEVIRRFFGHTAPINVARFSPDGNLIVSVAGDDFVGIWNVETGQLIRELRGSRTIAYTVAFSSDGRYVLTGGTDNTIRLWDLWEGQIVHKFVGHHDWIQSIAFSPDQKTALTASWDGTAILWNVKTGQELRRLTSPEGTVLYDVAYAPDGATALIAGGVHYGGPGDVILWDLNTGQVLRRYSGHTAFTNAVAFSHDGTTFMSGSGSGQVFLWDTLSGEIIRRFEENQLSIFDIVFSPDGNTVVTTSFDGNVILWDVETAQMIRRFIGHSGIVTSVDFTNDGQQMISRGINGSILWDVATGDELRRFFDPNGQVGGAIFSPDNRTVFGASGPDNAGLWDKETGRIIRFFNGHGPRMTAQAFFPDGQRVLVGFVNGDVELWNIDSLDELLNWTRSHRYIPDLSCQ
ncbi:MAG: WD40 repeat domain-containing protein, partial [Anaerolineae bacterium]|nr:WD40 repeat domain-containing protein [Anaerolineae bacterium]